MQEDPGRQSMSGSFNPIDVGEWSGQVYIGETDKFFAAISCGDRAAVARFLRQGADVDRRDHVGRTCLHLAIMSNAVDVACDLIDAGARLTARLVDGRSSLHLAVQMDQLVVVRKLFERSAVNAERKEGGVADTTMDVDPKELTSETERGSSQDDWSSEDGDGADDDDDDKDPEKETKKDTEDPKKPANANEIPEDQPDQPDVLDVNLADWDSAFTPLMYGVLYASPAVVEELLSAGADPQIVTESSRFSYPKPAPFHPLALTTIADEDDRIEKIVQRLLIAGASVSAADDKMFTIFHRAVAQRNARVVSTLLRYGANASIALNFPSVAWSAVTFPVITAISNGDYSVLALLLAHGVKLQLSAEDVSRAREAWWVYTSLMGEHV
jgi:ankyrin repeat protein